MPIDAAWRTLLEASGRRNDLVPNFLDPQSFIMVLALIVPGLIINYVRTQFITGRMQNHSDAILSYFTLSTIYGAMVLSTLNWLRQDELIEPVGGGL